MTTEPFKKFLLTSLVVIGLLGLFSLTRSAPRASGTLYLGTQAGYAPYETLDESGSIAGFDIDVAHALADKLGVRVIIKDDQFDNLFTGLAEGRYDMVMAGLSITQSRQSRVAMVPYQGEEMRHLSLTFLGQTQTIEHLRKKHATIAVMTGSWMEEFLTTISGLRILSLENNNDLVRALKKGKCTAALLEPNVADYYRSRNSKLVTTPLPLPQEWQIRGNGIAIRQDNMELTAKLLQGLQELREEGVLRELEQKWFKQV